MRLDKKSRNKREKENGGRHTDKKINKKKIA